MNIAIHHVERGSIVAGMCNKAINTGHYLHKMPDPRTSYEIYAIRINVLWAGFLVFGRPQVTRCREWFGSMEDVTGGRCEVTRWQILNLARVWLDPRFQTGGEFCNSETVPGFSDRHGIWHSSLASMGIRQWMAERAQDYLEYRPPVFLEEPYELRWLMSYCNTHLHRGIIYQAAGFKLYATNADGIQTWRIKLPELTADHDQRIKLASRKNQRAARIRAERAQIRLFDGVTL